MGKRKLSDQKIAELRKAYETWNPHDPGAESATDLAKRFGISKQTMYHYREQWLEEQAQDRNAGWKQDTDEAIRFLVSELVTARARIVELEQLLEGHNDNEPRP